MSGNGGDLSHDGAEIITLGLGMVGTSGELPGGCLPTIWWWEARTERLGRKVLGRWRVFDPCGDQPPSLPTPTGTIVHQQNRPATVSPL